MAIIIAMKKFHIQYAPQTKNHLHFIEHKHWLLIRETIEQQLSFEPDVRTKNRKPMRRSPVASWEIRFGSKNQFRVYYDINYEQGRVEVQAIGIKIRDKISIAGEEIPL